MRRHVAHHRALDRADIGDGRARLQMRRDLLRDLAAGADRDADDDEIGARDRGGIGLDHFDRQGQVRRRARRVGGGTRRRHDLAHGALRARGARDRAADQADADQRQVRTRSEAAVAVRVALDLSPTPVVLPKNSLSAATTRRLASSVPTVMRSAFGSL
jgi:hypothetical protein